MAKAKGTTSKPKRERVKKEPKVKAKKAKVTLDHLNDRQRQDLLYAHMGKVKPLDDQKKSATAAYNKALTLAEAEGIPKAMLKLALKLRHEKDGINTVKKEKETLANVARWLGVADQLDMFG